LELSEIKMKTNPVRAKLKRGEPSVGTWLNLPCPMSAQLMARTGFDWLNVELEHAPTSLETASQMFAIIAACGCVPLVRVPVGSVENIKRVLDCGAWGIVVPMVNSRAEAELVVRAARYRPVGERSIGGQLHSSNFATDSATYYAKANDEILVVVMAEHVDAIANLEQILSVAGHRRRLRRPERSPRVDGARPGLRERRAAVQRRVEEGARPREGARHRRRHPRRQCRAGQAAHRRRLAVRRRHQRSGTSCSARRRKW
jgi:hypothetical protein